MEAPLTPEDELPILDEAEVELTVAPTGVLLELAGVLPVWGVELVDCATVLLAVPVLPDRGEVLPVAVAVLLEAEVLPVRGDKENRETVGGHDTVGWVGQVHEGLVVVSVLFS